jgi:hypothetical protein
MPKSLPLSGISQFSVGFAGNSVGILSSPSLDPVCKTNIYNLH